MEESTDIGHELVAEVMEKSRHIVSFSVTPALKKPRRVNVVSKILVSHQDAKNLASRFATEESASEGGNIQTSWKILFLKNGLKSKAKNKPPLLQLLSSGIRYSAM
jgi:hypothetical protein